MSVRHEHKEIKGWKLHLTPPFPISLDGWHGCSLCYFYQQLQM